MPVSGLIQSFYLAIGADARLHEYYDKLNNETLFVAILCWGVKLKVAMVIVTSSGMNQASARFGNFCESNAVFDATDVASMSAHKAQLARSVSDRPTACV